MEHEISTRDAEISTRDAEIARIKAELNSNQNDAIPYKQLTQEIASNYPTVREVHIARGESLKVESIEQSSKTLIVVTYTSEEMDSTTHNKLENWLKIRLDEPNTKLFSFTQKEQAWE